MNVVAASPATVIEQVHQPVIIDADRQDKPEREHIPESETLPLASWGGADHPSMCREQSARVAGSVLDSVRLPSAPGSWAGNKEPLQVADMTIDQQMSACNSE